MNTTPPPADVMFDPKASSLEIDFTGYRDTETKIKTDVILRKDEDGNLIGVSIHIPLDEDIEIKFKE